MGARACSRDEILFWTGAAAAMLAADDGESTDTKLSTKTQKSHQPAKPELCHSQSAAARLAAREKENLCAVRLRARHQWLRQFDDGLLAGSPLCLGLLYWRLSLCGGGVLHPEAAKKSRLFILIWVLAEFEVRICFKMFKESCGRNQILIHKIEFLNYAIS